MIPVLAGVITANLLTVMMIYGFLQYEKYQREDRVKEIPAHVYIAVFMPMIFAIFAVLAAN